MAGKLSREEEWPALPLAPWADVCETLHMWTQIVGKVRLRASAPINHCWNATLYLTARGLTTSPLAHAASGRTFQIDFDFIDHALIVEASGGGRGELAKVPLAPRTTASFYAELMEALARLDVPVRIHGKPNEVADPIPFASDDVHRSYDAAQVNRFWRVLVQSDRVLKQFRSRFIGKCSPAHVFWGALDLAVTRFSGRRAPEHPGGIPNLPDTVTREAYSHEVSSCGFWAGTPGGPVDYPAYYAYAYPEPAGFDGVKVAPADAFYSPDLREFVLPYDAVRSAPDPDAMLLEFLQTTYEGTATLAAWDRAALERSGS